MKPTMSRVKYESFSDEEDDYSDASSFRPRGMKGGDENEGDDDLSSISFGALTSAHRKLDKVNRASPMESSEYRPKKLQRKPVEARRSKHAPAESLSKRRVSRIREIPGLQDPKLSTLHTDIRFDPAYGESDLQKTRKNYAFLDDYRKSEIDSMRNVLRDKKSKSFLGERDRDDLQLKIQSLQSRLDTMKNRDLELQILRDHKREQLNSVQRGEQANPYYLKKSDQRRLVQKAKFDLMKASQREKVMERKRKKRLGKEFRLLEFNQPKE